MHDEIDPVVKKYDKALNQANPDKNKLFIQLSLEGIVFCIFNSELNKFLSIESLKFEYGSRISEVSLQLKDLYSRHNWLSQPFQSVKLLLENNKSTLIPSPLFDETETSAFSKFNFTLTDDEILLFHKLNNLDAYILYPFSSILSETVNELFPTHSKFSLSGVFIEALLIINKNINSLKRIYVNSRINYLDIAILDGRKLLYYNTFGYRTKEDFIYYVIFVIEQLRLNPEEIELILSGNVDKNSRIFEIVYKYIRNVSFQRKTESFNYSYVINEIPPHHYFNLINLELCEL